MNTLTTALRTATFAALAALMATPADAAPRSSLFGRTSRSMMGMSDGATGELFTVTPGVRSFRAQLRGIGSIGYGGGAGGFNMRFAGSGLPRSIRSTNGSIVRLSPLRGGGMRGFVSSLRGARAGRPFNIFAGSGSLAERGGSTPTSFRFTGFDGFRANRQQLINDVPIFGPLLARLLDSGLGSVNLLLQRLSAAFIDPLNEIPADPDLVSSLLNTTAGGTISSFDGGGNAQEITSNAFDLLEYLRSLLPLLTSDVARLIERLLTRDLIAAFSEEAQLLSDLLSQLNDPAIDPPDYAPTDPGSPGVVEFTDDRTAVLENAGATFVYLTRTGGSLGETSAMVTLGSSSSAVPGSDFRFRTQTVKWKDGEAGPKAIAFSVINDNSLGGDVDFTLDLSSVEGAASTGSVTSATVVIVDDDGGGVAISRNTVLVCEYTWPRSKKDLDTGTTFLGETVGYNYNFVAPYMLWTGDDQNTGGREVVVIDIDGAVAAGEALSAFSIDCLADWFGPADGFGPATLSVYFRDKFSTRSSPRSSIQIAPTPFTDGGTPAHPNGSTMAITPVATVDVTFDDDAGIFTFGVANPGSFAPGE